MRNLLRLVLPLLMLQGCAGNPVAQQLERSFDQPAAKASGPDQQKTRESNPQPSSKSTSKSTSETDPSASADAQPVDATTQNERSDDPKPKADQAGNDKVKTNDAKGSDAMDNVGMQNDGVENDGEDKDQEDKSQELNDAGELPPSDLPQEPYRITIRLSAADPASPAEAVTRVLRQAGVPFAVERIERVEP
jgi:hypothetical protein